VVEGIIKIKGLVIHTGSGIKEEKRNRKHTWFGIVKKRQQTHLVWNCEKKRQQTHLVWNCEKK